MGSPADSDEECGVEEFLALLTSGEPEAVTSYLNDHGTRQQDASIECLDGCQWSIPDLLGNVAEMTPEEDDLQSGEPSLTAAHQPLEVVLTPEMSKLYCSDEPGLPTLGSDGYYVMQMFPSGVKRTVVERDNNILTLEEVRAHEKSVGRAMFE